MAEVETGERPKVNWDEFEDATPKVDWSEFESASAGAPEPVGIPPLALPPGVSPEGVQDVYDIESETPLQTGEKGVAAAQHGIGKVAATVGNIPVSAWNTFSRMTGIGGPMEPFQAGQSVLPKSMRLDGEEPVPYNPEAPPLPVPNLPPGEIAQNFELERPAMVEGLTRSGRKLAENVTTPEGLALLPTLAAKPAQIAFGAQMALTAPDQIKQTIQTLKRTDATAAEKWESLGDSAIHLAMTAAPVLHLKPEEVITQLTPAEARAATVLPRGAAAAREAFTEEPTTTEESNASGQQETTAVHGDLQPPAREGEGEMPAEESGGGIQPQAGGGIPEAPQGEILLSPEGFREKQMDPEIIQQELLSQPAPAGLSLKTFTENPDISINKRLNEAAEGKASGTVAAYWAAVNDVRNSRNPLATIREWENASSQMKGKAREMFKQVEAEPDVEKKMELLQKQMEADTPGALTKEGLEVIANAGERFGFSKTIVNAAREAVGRLTRESENVAKARGTSAADDVAEATKQLEEKGYVSPVILNSGKPFMPKARAEAAIAELKRKGLIERKNPGEPFTKVGPEGPVEQPPKMELPPGEFPPKTAQDISTSTEAEVGKIPTPEPAKRARVEPIEKQYKSVKAKYPDHLVLIRLGDFYEAFYDDAAKLAEAGNVALTKRKNIPMAGIPFHAVRNYVAKLEAAGIKVKTVEDYRTELGKPVSPGAATEKVAGRLDDIKAEAATLKARADTAAAKKRLATATGVKNELVSRLEKALADAPEKMKFGNNAKVVIEIPGDGKFTIINEKATIAQVLEDAKRLSTRSGEPTRVPRVSELTTHRARLNRIRDDAVEVYGNLHKAVAKIREQLANPDLELDARTKEELAQVADEMEQSYPENIAASTLQHLTDQLTDAREVLEMTQERLPKEMMAAGDIQAKIDEAQAAKPKRGVTKLLKQFVAAKHKYEETQRNIKDLSQQVPKLEALVKQRTLELEALKQKAAQETQFPAGPGAATANVTGEGAGVPTIEEQISGGPLAPERGTPGELLPTNEQAVTTMAKAVKSGLENLKGFIGAVAGKTFPRTTLKDAHLGALAARWVSSRIAAKPVSEVFVADVLGNSGVDPVKFGAALTEDNLQSIKVAFQEAANEATHRDEIVEDLQGQLENLKDMDTDNPDIKKEIAETRREINRVKALTDEDAERFTAKADAVKSFIGEKGFPFKNDDEYHRFLDDPKVKEVISRHKDLWKAVVEPQYKQAMLYDPEMELPSRGIQTGARINLRAVQEDEPPMRNTISTAGPGRLLNTLRRKSPFGVQAKGTADAYALNYYDIMQNTFGRQLEVANKNAFDQALVKARQAVIDQPGQDVMIDGQRAVEFPLRRQRMAFPGGGGVSQNQSLYVNRKLAQEYRIGANVDAKPPPIVIRGLNKVLNTAAISAATDATTHLLNQFSTLATLPGTSGRLLHDSVLSVLPGRPDAWVALGRALIKGFQDNRAQVASLAEIGALREEHPASGIGKLPPFAQFSTLIQKMDKLTRLALDDAYKRMAADGLVENSETARREFVNQVGQYNKRAQGYFKRLFRDTGLGPFVTAGTTFNTLGVRAITLNPGVRATSVPAALAIKANMVAKLAGSAATVMILNYWLTGKVGGRPGTRLGDIDTGKDDQNGRPLTLPIFSMIGPGRGLRVTGARGFIEAARQGLPAGTALDSAARDAINSAVSPWAGPPVKFAMTAATGFPTAVGVGRQTKVVPPGRSQFIQNLKEALIQASPISAGIAKAGEPGSTGLSEIIKSQLPRLAPQPGRPPEMMRDYPGIVRRAQANAFIEDIIGRARKMEPAERMKFLEDSVLRLEDPGDRKRAIRELKYRKVI